MPELDLKDISAELVDDELGRHGFLIVKNDFFLRRCEAARNEYLESIEKLDLCPTAEKFTYGQLCQKKYWRKAAISSVNGVGEPYAQLLTTTYYAPGSGTFPCLQGLFAEMIAVRNRLMRVGADFGSAPEKDGFWNASRIHHYPSGGGFMAKHRDTYFPLKLGDKPFYQVAALLSRRGTDFERGGGFVVSRSENKKVDLEDAGGFGSLVLFDGKTEHGVDDVDTHRLLDLRSKKGRLAAFVNIYVFLGK